MVIDLQVLLKVVNEVPVTVTTVLAGKLTITVVAIPLIEVIALAANAGKEVILTEAVEAKSGKEVI